MNIAVEPAASLFSVECVSLYLEDGCSRFLQNTHKYLPGCMACQRMVIFIATVGKTRSLTPVRVFYLTRSRFQDLHANCVQVMLGLLSLYC